MPEDSQSLRDIVIALRSDVQHLTAKVSETGIHLGRAEERISERLSVEIVEMGGRIGREEVARSSYDDKLTSSLALINKELIDELKRVDDKATVAKDLSSRLLWVFSGVLATLLTMTGAWLSTKLGK